MKIKVRHEFFFFVFLSAILFSQCAQADVITDIQAFKNNIQAPRQLVSYTQTGNQIDLQTNTLPIRIEVLKADLVKIRYSNKGSFQKEYTWSVLENIVWPSVSMNVTGTENTSDALMIATSALTVRVQKNPLLISILDANGKAVFENQGIFADYQDDPVNVMPPMSPAKRIILGSSWKMHDDEHFYGLGEKFRGAGDQSIDWRGRKRDYYTPGTEAQTMGNRFEGADGGANANMTVPFLWTTAGVGVFFDTVYKSYWEFDTPGSWFMKTDCDMEWELGNPLCEKSELRFYVTVASDVKTIFQRYIEITGKPIIPPRWALGYLQSSYGYKTWQEAHDVADDLRSKGFPIDALFLDLQWFGGVPGVHYESFDVNAATNGPYDNPMYRRIGTLQWFTNNNSDPAHHFDFSNAPANLAQFKIQGINVVPIEEGYLDGYTANFQEAMNNGFLAIRNFGDNDPAMISEVPANDATMTGYFGKVALFNAPNAAARAWFWTKHVQALADGAATFWNDLGEPERYRWWWKYPNEIWGNLWQQDIHNVWDLNRARMMFDGFQKDFPERRPFVMSRSGYAGSQRYGVGIWTADAPARLHWMASEPAVHLNLSISGVPYTTSDIGGFGGLPPSSPAQFTRWLQMESFSSLTRAHGNISIGGQTARIVNPAQFPDASTSPDGVDYRGINKKYLLWRESLIPYLYTYAREAYDTGMPILRALPLMWPQDANVQDNGSEYLFGANILVAPILTGAEGNPDTQRDVYFPAGQWIDLHDGTLYQGGQKVNIAAPLEKMPLFARSGAIIPKALPLQSVSDPTFDQTRVLEIYPAAQASSFSLYDDDATSNDYVSGKYATTNISVTPSATGVGIQVSPASVQGGYVSKVTQRSYVLEVYLAMKPSAVVANGTTATVEEAQTAPAFTTDTKAIYVATLKKLYIFGAPAGLNQNKSWTVMF